MIVYLTVSCARVETSVLAVACCGRRFFKTLPGSPGHPAVLYTSETTGSQLQHGYFAEPSFRSDTIRKHFKNKLKTTYLPTRDPGFHICLCNFLFSTKQHFPVAPHAFRSVPYVRNGFPPPYNRLLDDVSLESGESKALSRGSVDVEISCSSFRTASLSRDDHLLGDDNEDAVVSGVHSSPREDGAGYSGAGKVDGDGNEAIDI